MLCNVEPPNLAVLTASPLTSLRVHLTHGGSLWEADLAGLTSLRELGITAASQELHGAASQEVLVQELACLPLTRLRLCCDISGDPEAICEVYSDDYEATRRERREGAGGHYHHSEVAVAPLLRGLPPAPEPGVPGGHRSTTWKTCCRQQQHG